MATMMRDNKNLDEAHRFSLAGAGGGILSQAEQKKPITSTENCKKQLGFQASQLAPREHSASMAAIVAGVLCRADLSNWERLMTNKQIY
jgi:hypothetical protein